MKSFYFPMMLTVASNVIYHIAQKSIPSHLNPIIPTIIAYAVALTASLCLYPFFSDTHLTQAGWRDVNWATLAVGIAIVGIEIGFLLAYRAGWNISLGAVTSNVTVTLLLLPIGILFFKEHLSWEKITGIVLCMVGLWLIFKPS